MSDFLTFKYLQYGNKEQVEAFNIIKELDIEDYLKEYNPVLVGTIPIGINTEDSDLDIICEVDDFEEFYHKIKIKYSHLMEFNKSKIIYQNKESLICKFKYNNKCIEIFAQNHPVNKQNGFRHMIIEDRLLKILGENFKNEVISLKNLGLKTELAFCELINFEGNPYDELLTLENKSEDFIGSLVWENIFRKLSLYDDIIKVEKIYKGWSSDKKYFIETQNGNKYLLRISHKDTFEKKKVEIEKMKLISKLDIIMPNPMFISRDTEVMALFKWVDGEDLEDQITNYSSNQQYLLGYQAGVILNKIQSVTSDSFDWYEKYSQKIDKVISNYKECDVKFENDDKVIEFVERNKDVLKNRPITFQHGDYHLGNMIITSNDKVGIIDFNRSSFGDPWEEYDRFVFTWSKSTSFASGQLNGYFGGDVPDDFFKVMAVYCATNVLASIPWAINFSDEDVKTMLDNTELILDTYNNFNSYIPKWYIKNK